MIMLLLQFSIAQDRYALETSQIIEVLPLVHFRPCPGAPDYIAGQFNYRGTVIPAIDLCRLMHGRPCEAKMSTRIIVTSYSDTASGQHLLGLVAESMTDTIVVADKDLKPSELDLDQSRYLGKIACDKRGMIQCIRVEYLLPADVSKRLFSAGKAD